MIINPLVAGAARRAAAVRYGAESFITHTGPGRWSVAGVSWLCLALSIGAAAQVYAGTLTLDGALERAVEADPELQRLAAEQRAVAADGIAAGQLPDPQLQLGVMNMPVPELSFASEPMSQLQLGISQRFPARATRQARMDLASARAATLDAEIAARRLDVRMRTRRLWVELQHRQQMLAIQREKAAVMERLTETLDARRAVSRAYQTAVLSSRARRARLEKSLTDHRAAIARTRAALGELLAPGPLPEDLEPARLDTPPAPTIDDHPEIAVASRRVQEAHRRVDEARAAFRPGWQASVGLGQRVGDTPMGAPSDTLIFASVAIDLPLFTRNRQSRRLEAAHERVGAADAGPVEVRRRLNAAWRSADDLYAEYDALVASYTDSVLVLAREQEAAEQLRYRSGEQELDPVLEARLARLEHERERVELALERDRAAITLYYLGGR